jgi:Bromodomain
MPPLSAYTPFESLLFFQCLASLAHRPTNFSAISDTLRKNQFIKDDAAFDNNRLSPQALEELYTSLLQEGFDEHLSVGEKNGHLQDGNTKKRKISSNIAGVSGAQSHTAIVPEVVSQLYARYKDRVTKEIRDEEKRFRDISEEIKKLEDAVEAAPEKKAGVPPPISEPMDVDIDVKEEVAPAASKPPELQPRPAIPTHQQPIVPTTTPIPSHGPSIQDAKRQAPPKSPLPGVAPLQPQQILQQQTKQAPGGQPPITFTPPLKAPVNGKGTTQPPALLQPSPKIQVQVPPPPQQQQQQQQQRLPQPAPRVSAASRQPNLPPGSTIVFQAQGPPLPATPTGQRHAGEGSFAKGAPVPAAAQAQQFQPWTAPASIPATPHAPYGAQPIQPIQPMLNRPVMPKQGNFVPQPIPGFVPVTPAPLALPTTQTPTGTPSMGVKARAPRPSMDTAGSLTPWKRTPNLRIDIPETPGSPPRPKPEDVSPISERAPSPEPGSKEITAKKRGEPERSRRRKQEVASKGEKTAKKRAESTTSTRSRARSVTSRDEESTDVPTRKIKHEAPSTPAGLPEDIDVETRAGTRRKAAATSLEEAHAKRPKRKRGASEALEVETPSTRAVSSQLVYCTRNFTRTGAPIINDVATHKHASIFAKPLTERDAPGYKDLIYRPQDLKSIKSALTHGNKAIAAATEAVNTAEGESPNPTGTPSKNTAWLAKTAELIPPKAIVNSSQLEKELIRMFANAVMFNPAPDRERGFGGSFQMRKPNERTPSSHPWELDEGGIIRDTREMCDDVEKAVTKWRAAERTTTDDSAKSMLSLRGSSDSNADGTDADIINKG